MRVYGMWGGYKYGASEGAARRARIRIWRGFLEASFISQLLLMQQVRRSRRRILKAASLVGPCVLHADRLARYTCARYWIRGMAFGRPGGAQVKSGIWQAGLVA